MFLKWVLSSAAMIAAVHGGAAFAQTSVAADATIAEASDEIVIIGRGETRQVQTVSGVALQDLAPGTSPIKLVQRLPGVAVSGADSFGTYEWAARINIRGFTQNQLGFTLDGVPLGDMSYGNHNGLHISRALISENLGSVQLSQGSGALDVASTGQLGGALRYFSVAPQEKFGGVAALTAGSDSTFRGFVRLESGEIGGLGTRGWIAYVDQQADKWKGDGEQNQEQYAIKVEQPIGAATVSGYWNHSERQEQDYQDLSLAQIARLGYDWDNFGDGQFALAVRVADIAHNRGDTGQPVTNAAAGVTYPAPIQTADDAYWNAAGIREDDIGYIKLDLPIGDAVDVTLQAYTHENRGQGLWGTPYVVSPNATNPTATTNNAPFSVRTTEYEIERQGFIGSATFELGAHTINGGFWYETNDATQARRFYAVNRSNPSRSFLGFQSGAFFTQWAYAFETETLQFHVQDTWQVSEALKVNLGFRSINVDNAVRTTTINNAAPVAGADSNLIATLNTEENFLPQAGFVYVLNDTTEVFGAYAQNTAAFVSAVTAGPFASRSQANVEEVRRSLDPETSQTFELGLRRQTDVYRIGATAYLVQFDDRLLAVAQGSGIVGNAPVLSNVGSVETVGVELVGDLRINDDWTLFGAYTYNNSEYQDDVRNRTGVVQAATAGKRVVNTPENIFFGELSYDDGSLFGSVSANYLGDRFFTFTNNGGRVEGRTIIDLNLGYRFSGNAFLKGIEAQLNVTNLTDEDYVGTLGTNGFVNSGDSQTLVAGAPQQVFVTLRKRF